MTEKAEVRRGGLRVAHSFLFFLRCCLKAPSADVRAWQASALYSYLCMIPSPYFSNGLTVLPLVQPLGAGRWVTQDRWLLVLQVVRGGAIASLNSPFSYLFLLTVTFNHIFSCTQSAHNYF